MGGLGYSNNGYNGPFTTAITMNGQIVADFITTGTLTANIIRAGILSSALGDSYFNLESGLIHTASAEIVGGSISIGGGTYKTVIADGSIQQYLTSATHPLGGLVPVGSGSSYYEAIYVSNQSNAKGVSLAYQNSDGSFTAVGEFCKTEVNINKPAYFREGIETNLSYTNRFAGITHYRTADFAGDGSAYTALCAVGCGIASRKPSAALEIRYEGSSQVESRLDVYASDGAAMICLRGNYHGQLSNELELGKNIWFNGIMYARSFDVYSLEEIKENITPCGSALDVLRSATVYRYNLKPEPTLVIGTQSVDGDEVEIPADDSTPVKDSIGFVINEETPEILLSEDGRHISLYTAISLNWKATQEILQRLEALEGSEN